MSQARQESKRYTGIELNYNQVVLNGVNLDKALSVLKEKGDTIKRIDWSNCFIGDKEVKKIAEALAVHPSVTEVYLHANQIGDEGALYLAEALKKNKIITKLNLCTNKIKNDGAQFIVDAVVEGGREFELNLSGNEEVTPAKQIALRQRAKDSKALHYTLRTQSEDVKFENKDLSDVRLNPILFSLRKQPVSKLKLANCSLSDAELAQLAHLIDISQKIFIEELDLSGNRITDVGIAILLQTLKNCSALKKLNVSKNSITEEGICEIIRLAMSHPNHPEINVSENGEKACFGLKNKKCTGSELTPILHYLKTFPCSKLSLINCSLEDKEISKLAAVLDAHQLVFLREIDLSMNVISNEGVINLAKVLEKCTFLEKINLSHNKISDTGACALAEALRKCTNLQQMNLSNNRICEIGIEKIRSAIVDHPGSPELNLLENSAVFEVVEEDDDELEAHPEIKKEHKESKSEKRKTALNTYPAIFGLPRSALDEDHFLAPKKIEPVSKNVKRG